MTHLEILLPFAQPPAELSSDLQRQLDTPALATLCARARTTSRESFNDYARALPHEHWLARQLGLETAQHDGSSPPFATALLREHGHAANEGHWFILHPIHIHIARDHLVLTDRRMLGLDETEARALFEIARELFSETGKPLLYGDAGTWFTRADEWQQLLTATPDAAGGHNIDLWMPRGDGERDWRKLQNEVQMHWFTHPVNVAREAQGQRTVNSLWLWGGAGAAQHVSPRFDRIYATASDTLPAARRVQEPGQVLNDAAPRTLLVLDQLLAPAVANDWGRWLEQMQELERTWFVPLLEALRGGELDEIALVASGELQLARYAASRSSLRKFWIKPTLDALLS